MHLPPFLPPHFQPELQLINFIRIYHLIKFMREHHPMRYNRMTEILKMVSRTKSGFDNSVYQKFGESNFSVNQKFEESKIRWIKYRSIKIFDQLTSKPFKAFTIVFAEELFFEITSNSTDGHLFLHGIHSWIHCICPWKKQWHLHALSRCPLDNGGDYNESWLWWFHAELLDIKIYYCFHVSFWDISNCFDCWCSQARFFLFPSTDRLQPMRYELYYTYYGPYRYGPYRYRPCEKFGKVKLWLFLQMKRES